MSLYFAETGSRNAPVIVFIHGGGVSGWMWKKQVGYFSDFHCIVPDLPRHGKSPDEILSVPDSARQLADLIETIAGGKSVHVVGHSLGGKILVELLSLRPELVDRAVVASALFRPVPFLRLLHYPFVYRWTVDLLKSKSILRWAVNAFQFPDQSYTDNALQEFSSLTADRLYNIYDQMYQHLSLPAGLEKAAVPALVLAGTKEPKAMRKSVADLVSAMPNARGALLAQANHTYPWSMHETFNQIIRLWITGGELPDELEKLIVQ